MKIREIVVPKSKEAELALDFDEASDSELFILQLNEDEFTNFGEKYYALFAKTAIISWFWREMPSIIRQN